MKKLSEIYKELGIAFIFPIEIYDSNGNVTYVEEIDGYWCRYKYDSRDNETFREDSDGYWCRYEYDSRDNETYFENSKGYWCRYEYDSNGDETYFENSKGVKTVMAILKGRPNYEKTKSTIKK
jgi:hypothetical protein